VGALVLLCFLFAWVFLVRRRRPGHRSISFDPFTPAFRHDRRTSSIDAEMASVPHANIIASGVPVALASTSTIGRMTSDLALSSSNLSQGSQAPLISQPVVPSASGSQGTRVSFGLPPAPPPAAQRRAWTWRLRPRKDATPPAPIEPVSSLAAMHNSARRPPPTPLYRLTAPVVSLNDDNAPLPPPRWPGSTPSPHPPSPAGTVGTVPPTEGLLHPGLCVSVPGALESEMSFADHLDYSRPISAVSGSSRYHAVYINKY
jgi:hypothetical protein